MSSYKQKQKKKTAAPPKGKAAVVFALSGALRYVAFVGIFYGLNRLVNNLVSNPQLFENNIPGQSMTNKFLSACIAAFLSVMFIEVIDSGKYRPKLIRKPLSGTLLALGSGALRIGISVLILWVLGLCKIEFDSRLGNGAWLFYTLGAFFDALYRETVIRGYAYEVLRQRHNETVAMSAAIVVTCVNAVNAWQSGVLPLLTVATSAVFLNLLYAYTGSLYAPVMAHFFMSFFGGVIIDGVPLGGFMSFFDITLTGGTLFSGGYAYLSGSTMLGMTNLLLIGVLLVLIKKRDGFSRFLSKGKAGN